MERRRTMFYKAVITSKGLALDAKIKAGQTTAAFTRVKLGDGTRGTKRGHRFKEHKK